MSDRRLGDPREKIRCACPRIDPRDCAEVRFPLVAALARAGSLDLDGAPVELEPCECPCHDTDPDDEYDIDAMQDAAVAS